MRIEIIPYPEGNIEIKKVGIAGDSAGLKNNTMPSKSPDNATCQTKKLGISLLLDVVEKNVRFFWGDFVKPFDYSSFSDPVEINIPCPIEYCKERRRYNESDGQQECGS